MVSLGTLLGGLASIATGINAGGQVVGDAYSSGPVCPFLYSNGAMIDLNTLIDPVLGLDVIRSIRYQQFRADCSVRLWSTRLRQPRSSDARSRTFDHAAPRCRCHRIAGICLATRADDIECSAKPISEPIEPRGFVRVAFLLDGIQ